jgi:hypothetical protein
MDTGSLMLTHARRLLHSMIPCWAYAPTGPTAALHHGYTAVHQQTPWLAGSLAVGLPRLRHTGRQDLLECLEGTALSSMPGANVHLRPW